MNAKKSVDPTISTIAALLGSRGGKAKSTAKTLAGRENAKKARAARWSGKRAVAAA
jgi:hypothetical protein